MKLFVVVGGWDYAGNDLPIGVYSTRDLAEAARKVARGYDGGAEIFEYELDKKRED